MTTLTLLTTAKLLNLLLLIKVLRVKGHADAHANVVLDAAPCLFIRLLDVLAAIRLPLDDQPAVTSRHQLAENRRKLLGHLLEGTLNGLVLSAVEVLHELFDGSLGVVQLLATLHQLLLLRREVVVLLVGLFVDVLVLFQRFVDLFQLGRNLASS